MNLFVYGTLRPSAPAIRPESEKAKGFLAGLHGNPFFLRGFSLFRRRWDNTFYPVMVKGPPDGSVVGFVYLGVSYQVISNLDRYEELTDDENSEYKRDIVFRSERIGDVYAYVLNGGLTPEDQPIMGGDFLARAVG